MTACSYVDDFFTPAALSITKEPFSQQDNAHPYAVLFPQECCPSAHRWLCERAILCPKNDDVTITNDTLLTRLPGPLRTYKSIDTVYEKDEVVNYPTEFLNSLEISGIPQHKLNLKERSLIMLLRNLDPPNLCNGTRMSVKKLHNNITEATVLTGPAAGTDVLIPRIPIIPSDISFQFKRLQFPVRLSFAITINKAKP
ncbi:ATP-dependent DNA helicase PIF1-like [Uloborus diversus]|uniref:ATP-dependent DNA helicase PIF1-like n=1 Tax=Uloborus diversus TaxID=327109 RepID=UPI00240999DB|nr:ATP-dependent DNA helicase PIF1-like [Uloborus diversus]